MARAAWIYGEALLGRSRSRLGPVHSAALGAKEPSVCTYESRTIRGHHDAELAVFLHRDRSVARAESQLREVVRGLFGEGVKTGDVRGDIPSEELAAYCLHALAAATGMPSKAAVRRLVSVTLAGLLPPPDRDA